MTRARRKAAKLAEKEQAYEEAAYAMQEEHAEEEQPSMGKLRAFFTAMTHSSKRQASVQDEVNDEDDSFMPAARGGFAETSLASPEEVHDPLPRSARTTPLRLGNDAARTSP